MSPKNNHSTTKDTKTFLVQGAVTPSTGGQPIAIRKQAHLFYLTPTNETHTLQFLINRSPTPRGQPHMVEACTRFLHAPPALGCQATQRPPSTPGRKYMGSSFRFARRNSSKWVSMVRRVLGCNALPCGPMSCSRIARSWLSVFPV